VPSKASRGNFLEAINVTLNVLEKHYMDRDLARTGNSIVMISPCTGVMEVRLSTSEMQSSFVRLVHFSGQQRTASESSNGSHTLTVKTLRGLE
jgi:L-lactate permease